MSRPIPTPARAREAVARYLPADDESRFTRGLAAYARCQDGCLDRAAGDPECRDVCRRSAAATLQAGVPALECRMDCRSGGVGLAPMRDDLVAQGMPGDRVGDDDRGSLGAHENAQRKLDAVAGAGAVLDGVAVTFPGHAGQTEPAPGERQAPRGGHTELTIARFVHEDARIRGGGELPAVWSVYS